MYLDGRVGVSEGVSPGVGRRREGNRRAAQRLRQRRTETVSRLQAEINRLEQERLVYLNHIYQLAASARSVVAENKALRGRLDVLQSGSPALVSRSPRCKLAAKPWLPPKHLTQACAAATLLQTPICTSHAWLF